MKETLAFTLLCLLLLLWLFLGQLSLELRARLFSETKAYHERTFADDYRDESEGLFLSLLGPVSVMLVLLVWILVKLCKALSGVISRLYRKLTKRNQLSVF